MFCMLLNGSAAEDGKVADLLSEMRKANNESEANDVFEAHVLGISIHDNKERSNNDTHSHKKALGLKILKFMAGLGNKEIDEIGRLTGYEEYFKQFKLPSGSIDDLLSEMRNASSTRVADGIFEAHVLGISMYENNERWNNDRDAHKKALKLEIPRFLEGLENEEIDEN